MNIENVSTAYDMARLSAIAIKNDYFRKVVSTATYTCTAKNLPKDEDENSSSERNKKRQPRNPLTEKGKPNPEDAVNLEPNMDAPSLVSKKFKWTNTNLMLKQPGYNGLKTGITEAAGPCRSASYLCPLSHTDSCHAGHHYVVILLNSRSMDARWGEVAKLIQWTIVKEHQNQTDLHCLPFL